MGSIYITRWPASFLDVEITGTTVKYLDTGEVLFENEMFSPGMELCKWRSQTPYLTNGISPTLPLLETGKRYTISAVLSADHEPAVQLRVTFFDINGDKIDEVSSTVLNKTFVFPEGAVSYEVGLINLNHLWIKFNVLVIREADDDRVVEARMNRRGGWAAVHPATMTETDKSLDLRVGRGPLTTIELPASDTGNNQLTVSAYVNETSVDEVLTDIQQRFAEYELTNFDYLPGHFNRLTTATRTKIAKFQKQFK